MDTKSLAKSKRAHTQHHKKHHPNQKVKGVTSSLGSSNTTKVPVKAANEKPRQFLGQAKLPSNWDRYEDEDDSLTMTENQIHVQSSQPSDVVVPKSKGSDYAYLIAEAKSQKSTRSSSEIFPSLDDFVSDFGQGKDLFFAVRGESLLSSIQNDSFFVDDKTPASHEASFLSLNLHALSEQLAKIDLPKRLFVEDDLFPPKLYADKEPESQNPSPSHENANIHEVTSYRTTESHYDVIPAPNPDPIPSAKISENQSTFKAESAEAELDVLLDSFADTNLKEKPSTSTSKQKTVAFDIDSTLDDLLIETSFPAMIDQNDAVPPLMVNSIPISSVSSSSQKVSKSELLDDFDSWLDTI